MRTAFFSDYQLPGPARRGLTASPWARPGQASSRAWGWPDELVRHQAIYEELLASPDWARQAAPPLDSRRRALTRDLAG